MYVCLCVTILSPPPTSTLFPYTTLFRSHGGRGDHGSGGNGRAGGDRGQGDRQTGRLQPGEPPRHRGGGGGGGERAAEHTSELQAPCKIVRRLVVEKKKDSKKELVKVKET